MACKTAHLHGKGNAENGQGVEAAAEQTRKRPSRACLSRRATPAHWQCLVVILGHMAEQMTHQRPGQYLTLRWAAGEGGQGPGEWRECGGWGSPSGFGGRAQANWLMCLERVSLKEQSCPFLDQGASESLIWKATQIRAHTSCEFSAKRKLERTGSHFPRGGAAL